MARQSRRQSLLEAVTNVGIGYAVAVFAQSVVFPLFGLRTSLTEDLAIAAIFTALSVLRSYLVRRAFVWLDARAAGEPG